MIKTDMQITSDIGLVIYDIDTNQYFCGLKKWDKKLRKAKIYHSMAYATQAIQLEKDKNTGRNNLKIFKVEIRLIGWKG